MTWLRHLAAFRFDFERSTASLARERAELIWERQRRVLNHQAVSDIDSRLRPLTNALLRKRRRAGRVFG